MRTPLRPTDTEGVPSSRRSISDPDVQAYLDWVRVECGAAENTLKAYRADLALYLQQLPGQRAASAEPEHVLEFLAAEQQRGMSPRTCARRLVAVRCLHRWLASERRMDDDPAARIEGPELWDRLPHCLQLQEVDRLLEPPEERTPPTLRAQAVLEVLYACGLRASEVAHLRISAVRFDEALLRTTGKGGKDRVVPFGRRAAAALHDWLDEGRPQLASAAATPTDPVFLSDRGRPLSRDGVWRIVRRRADAAGVAGKVSPHTLRHSFATHLLHGGANLRWVQAMLGHASLRTTQIYTRVDSERMRSTHAQFHPRG